MYARTPGGGGLPPSNMNISVRSGSTDVASTELGYYNNPPDLPPPVSKVNHVRLAESDDDSSDGLFGFVQGNGNETSGGGGGGQVQITAKGTYGE